MANRKLMAEVDRTVKKVNEGIENFDELEEKVYSAQSSSQRDKFEGELKKEIKKLQRLREQIRTWISGNEIKDKELLVEKRQQIENRMERFKKCEQKTKMKAYSKEALSKSQVEKRHRNKQNIIPDSKEKKQAKKWLKDVTEQLANLVLTIDEKIEEEEEKEKKKDDGMIETYRARQRKHEDYIEKLNQIYEFLDNDEGILPQDLDDLKEYVEYYIDENEEAEFVEDEETFEAIFSKQKEWEESAPKEELVDVDEVKDSIKNLDDESEEEEDYEENEEDHDEDLTEDEDEELSSPVSTSSSRDEEKPSKSATSAKPKTTTAVPTTTTTAKQPQPTIQTPATQTTTTSTSSANKKPTKPSPPAINTTSTSTTTTVPTTGGQTTPASATPTSVKPSYSDLVKSPKTPLQPPQQPTNVATTATTQNKPTSSVPQTSTATATTAVKKPTVSYIDIAQQNKSVQQGHNLTVALNDSVTTGSKQAPTVSTPTSTTPTTTAATTAQTTAVSSTSKKQASTKQPASKSQSQQSKKAQSTTPTLPNTTSTTATSNTTPTSSDAISPIQPVPSTPSPTTIDKNNDETFSVGMPTQFGLEDLSSQTQQNLFVNQIGKMQQAGVMNPLLFAQNSAITSSFPPQIPGNQIPSFPPATPTIATSPINTTPSVPPSIFTSSSTYNSVVSNQFMSDMLHSSMRHLPDAYDCNFVYPYFPVNENPPQFRAETEGFPIECPLHNPMHALSNPATYSLLSVDTLFFIFYFQQGTYYQYLAAKELKRQAWRFHKKYLTWFQRHDKPTVTTNEYEQGTYVYFDADAGWCQRIKEGFSFEYAYLEDEL
ncbi:hypothetical protein C9374_003373 [Naegleria lovaniensis]|uniref:CCR4-NOT transcription complex subunit 3 n=1 Tax=Naegleria lovaniensis TaxID=51637 RepID=A0AA88GT46_NAELO|nr:uncharacterized protein C9374_003373 [Naegleria lovaniensis]KAG2385558.1 hypothetical protein C9374_003373 [Naegleria lovaniensis]